MKEMKFSYLQNYKLSETRKELKIANMNLIRNRDFDVIYWLICQMILVEAYVPLARDRKTRERDTLCDYLSLVHLNQNCVWFIVCKMSMEMDDKSQYGSKMLAHLSKSLLFHSVCRVFVFCQLLLQKWYSRNKIDAL